MFNTYMEKLDNGVVASAQRDHMQLILSSTIVYSHFQKLSFYFGCQFHLIVCLCNQDHKTVIFSI
jgi:hypothetical protein